MKDDPCTKDKDCVHSQGHGGKCGKWVPGEEPTDPRVFVEYKPRGQTKAKTPRSKKKKGRRR